ncbi:C40 family peptidase [Phytohabitans rumicis]|nr:C40 family peptidase [Phytohabitans rumicis]
MVSLLPAVPAQAEPTVDEIEAQIDAKWEQLEPVIEQYNKVHSQLKTNQQKAADLRDRIQPLQLQANLALVRIGSIASRYYMTGPTSDVNALLSTGSPTTFTDQLTILDMLAAKERAQVADVVAAREKLDTEKQRLDALITQQQKQDAELGARKKQIDGEIAKLQKLRDSAIGTSSKSSLYIGACPAVYIGGAAGTAVRTACNQIGKPYVWGADGPGSFDCSGLTQYAWGKAGVSLTHHAADQWNEGAVIGRDSARPGDLVFFYSDLHHVGMYVGNGLMVHAPRSGKPVQMATIDTMPLRGFRRPS